MKKFFSILLVAFLSLSVLSGCSRKQVELIDYHSDKAFTNKYVKDLDVEHCEYETIRIGYGPRGNLSLGPTDPRYRGIITISEDEAKDFIRQVANLCEKQFSFQTPNLDASLGTLRINATHPSIARKNSGRCLNFAIRVAKEPHSLENQISEDGESTFADLLEDTNTLTPEQNMERAEDLYEQSSERGNEIGKFYVGLRDYGRGIGNIKMNRL